MDMPQLRNRIRKAAIWDTVLWSDTKDYLYGVMPQRQSKCEKTYQNDNFMLNGHLLMLKGKVMDRIDEKLLLLLRKDARVSATDLAKQLSVSRGTIQNRIDKLVHTGVIKRFTVEMGQNETDHQISAFALIQQTANDGKLIKAALRRIEEITEVSTLNGSFDLVIEINCATLARLDAVMDEVRNLPDVADTQTHIRLTTSKN